MNERALRSLEFDKIRAQCATHTASDIGREFVAALHPTDDLERAELLLRETWEADAVCRRIGGSPVDTFPDARNTLSRVKASYALSPAELLNLAACLKASRRARERLLAGENEATLHRLANPLSSHVEIESEVARCILTEDEIADNASPELNRIRRQMRITLERVKEKLNSFIKSPTYQKYLQEPIVTVRNGRYAIPVKAEHRAQIGGLIHDQSGSGQTVFIEPTAVVELGNAYKQLQAEEKREIERILAGLTALIAPYADELYQSLMLLGNLDCIFARAILADPRILVLDEATASVDTLTEQRIQSAIDTVIEGRTSLVIAHRLSTVRNADLILVVKDGKIVEQGTHKELIAAKGPYYRLYTRQYEDEQTRGILQ